MKALPAALRAIAAAAILPAPALAAVIFVETFSYPDGELVGQSGQVWTAYRGTGGNIDVPTDILVVNGMAFGDMKTR